MPPTQHNITRGGNTHVDEGRDGGPDATRGGRLVQDGELVRAGERGADRIHVQRLFTFIL